jgi:hypothetical protein
MKYFILLFLCSCSQLSLTVDNKPRNDIQFISHGKYFEVRGGENILRKLSAVTLQIEFKETGAQNTIQDMMAISVGGNTPKSYVSRASLRLEPGGRLVGIARSTDSEEGQVVKAKKLIPKGKSHVATLVIDYAQNEMKLYLDGKELETEGKVSFSSKETPDTASISFAVGSEDDGSNFHFEGTLRNPKIWTRKLNEEEIMIK